MKARILLSTGFLAVVILLLVRAQRHLNESGAPPQTTQYICPIKNGSESSVVATCTDCMYYPLDKTHSLPESYQPTVVPTGLPGGGAVLPAIRPALVDLFTEARKQGLFPVVTSAYRSYKQQAMTFVQWVMDEWQSTHNPFQAILNANEYSAWPGHSEHQLGTAIDVNCLGCKPFDDQDSRNVALWRFLQENAHSFGFVISYPQNDDDRTGYQYEPWHIRYVGVAYATELYKQDYTSGNGVCLLALLRTMGAKE